MTSSSSEWKIEGEGGHEKDDHTDPQEHRHPREGMAEDIAKPHPQPRPGQRAHHAVADKAREPCLGCSGQPARNCVQLWQEPGPELKCPLVVRKNPARATDQQSSVRRDPPENLEASLAAPTTHAVPRQVG